MWPLFQDRHKISGSGEALFLSSFFLPGDMGWVCFGDAWNYMGGYLTESTEEWDPEIQGADPELGIGSQWFSALSPNSWIHWNGLFSGFHSNLGCILGWVKYFLSTSSEMNLILRGSWKMRPWEVTHMGWSLGFSLGTAYSIISTHNEIPWDFFFFW